MVIKISLPTGTQMQARITSQDGYIKMKVNPDLVGHRFADKVNDKVGFFNAVVDKDSGALEIADRLPAEAW